MANSPSIAMILRLSGAPTMSQKAALPAEVAMPMPDGPPFDVVGEVGRFGVSGERADAADLRLRHEGVVCESGFFEQGIERAASRA